MDFDWTHKLLFGRITRLLDAYTFDWTQECAIDLAIPLRSGTSDAEYLNELENGLKQAFTDFPDAQLVIYNAGTDVLESDRLGRLAISAKGILRRDQLVFEHCRRHNVPVAMVTSGGYTRQSAKLISASLCPVVYSPDYNINSSPIPLCLVKMLHPFDAHKWGNVHKRLLENGALSQTAVQCPTEASQDLLRQAHTEQYLHSLHSVEVLSRVLELPLNIARFLGSGVLSVKDWTHDRILRPMRLQTGGTVLAAELALRHGWAINIGGGFHHACGYQGGGFCVYADISIALKALFREGRIQRAMIIDLDAHQGNGHERDFLGDSRVYIMDMYNTEIYPDDMFAKSAIDLAIPLRSGTADVEYLAKLEDGLKKAFTDFPGAQLVIYNAGTDVLESDRLGQLAISAKGILRRDQLVFEHCNCSRHNVPVAMVTSGGYTSQSAKVIADSILNLHQRKLIHLK